MSVKKIERDGERLFTQKELEALISERLMRERKNCEAYKTVKDILCEMMKDGLINAHSYAEAARELYEKLSVIKAGNTEKNDEVAQELCILDGEGTEENEANECKESEDSAAVDCSECPVDGALEKCTEDDIVAHFPVSEEFGELPETVLSDDNGKNGGRTGEMCELMEAYPELCIEALLSDEGFIMYSKRYKGTLKELYEGYSRVKAALGKIGGEDGEKSENGGPGRRRMASTSFSRCSASPNSDIGFELSSLQRDIARRAGLSYREYFEMLREIPDSKKISSR